jgi:hypothetical protein
MARIRSELVPSRFLSRGEPVSYNADSAKFMFSLRPELQAVDVRSFGLGGRILSLSLSLSLSLYLSKFN